MSEETQASDQLRAEISNVIRRYSQESDITIFQAIGVLEVCKLDLALIVRGEDEGGL